MHLKREPVFLVIDNVTDNDADDNSWKEANEYLMAGFHPESRVVITSRSRSSIRGLVPGIQFCMPMPRLNVTEAGELFMRSAVPEKSIFGHSAEEQRIVALCIRECLFFEAGVCDSGEDEEGVLLLEEDVHKAREMRYHPVALSALGDFFRRYFSNTEIMLCWPNHLKENKDPLWDLWKSSNGIGGIIGLQFHSLHPSERLLFLDVAALIDDDFTGIYLHNNFNDGIPWDWLCKVHDKTRSDMERQVSTLLILYLVLESVVHLVCEVYTF